MAIEEKSVHQRATDSYIKAFTTVFATGGTRGTPVDLDGRTPVRIHMPSTWINTQSTLLHIQLSTGGTTYQDMWSANTAYTVAVAKSKAVVLDTSKFWGVNYIRLHSTLARGTAATQHYGVVTIIARVI